MKVLVTGGGGFLGRYIVKELQSRNYDISILGRSPQDDLVAQGIKFIQGNITDVEIVEQACSEVDAVFHVAAKAGVWGNWNSFYQPNVIGTQNIIKACNSQKVTKLIYTSTPSVVFNGDSFSGANESLPYGKNWLCHYAHTKAIAEKEILEANGTNGLKTIALRPHLIFGKGDPHLLPRVIQKAKSEKLRIVGNGQNRVDITHVTNAASAHVKALDALENNHPGGKAYFLSQDQPVVLWQWINQLLKKLNIPKLEKNISLKKAYNIGFVMEVIWKTLNLKGEPPMTRFVAVELAKNHWYDISAAKNDLGYEATVSTDTGLNQFVKSIK